MCARFGLSILADREIDRLTLKGSRYGQCHEFHRRDRTRDQPTVSTVSPTSFTSGWLTLQSVQFDALLAFQRSILAAQRNLWDGWLCRHAGGISID